jgi:hypothetical protein
MGGRVITGTGEIPPTEGIAGSSIPSRYLSEKAVFLFEGGLYA